jgi:hypothetical protein
MTKSLLATCRPPLRAILKQCQQLERLAALVMPLLSPELRAKAKIASYRQGCLHFIVPNGTWGTKLRYTFPEIQPKLTQYPEFQQLTRCECSIDLEAMPVAQTPPAPKLSAATAQLLQDVAQHTPNRELSAALLRLARNSGKK